VFVHGSNPLGRRSPTSRLWIHALTKLRDAVLALDLRGFGASADPAIPWTDVGFDEDLRAASRVAEERGWARPGEFVYVGHSLGAGVVLHAARLIPRPLA
jgi:pimeloyl-ACP methyl ester carboxylesterase